MTSEVKERDEEKHQSSSDDKLEEQREEEEQVSLTHLFSSVNCCQISIYSSYSLASAFSFSATINSFFLFLTRDVFHQQRRRDEKKMVSRLDDIGVEKRRRETIKD